MTDSAARSLAERIAYAVAAPLGVLAVVASILWFALGGAL